MGARIGLITPYQGSNLGDGAIQDAMLSNLRRIDPSIECLGITLYPADLVKRHGIVSIPITGLAVRHYSEPELLFAREFFPLKGSPEVPEAGTKTTDNAPLPPPSDTGLVEHLRSVKNLPFLGRVLRYLVFRLRDARKVLVEIRELARDYRFARNLALLVVSGGGQLDEAHGGPWGHPYSMFRWAMIGKLTRTPLAVVSVGSAKLESGLTRWFVKHTLRSALYRSYRDTGTRNQLSYLQFTRRDPIVRDLALGLDPKPYMRGPRDPRSQRVIAVSPIYHTDPAYTTYADFVTGVTDFIQWLIERGDRVLLFRTTSIERLVLQDIWTNLRARFLDRLPGQVEEVMATCYQDVLKQIAVADLVLASRLHSIILAHVLRKPTLAISWDRKVKAHMEDLNQAQYMIDIQSADADAIKTTFRVLERDAETIRTALQQRITELQKDLNKQYDTLLRLAG